MKKISKRLFLASLALSFGASQSVSANFDLKEIKPSKSLIAHNVPGGHLDGECGAKHAQVLTNAQADYEKKQAEKKKKKNKKQIDSRAQVEEAKDTETKE